MSTLIPLSQWAAANGLSRDQALNLARADKIPGARLRKVTLQRWYAPADARPTLADRRRKNAIDHGSPNVRTA